jgi:hypothetical protein
VTATLSSVWGWLDAGVKESGAMVRMTFWPLVLGFTLSRVVQIFLPRDGRRSLLGTTTPGSVARASATHRSGGTDHV